MLDKFIEHKKYFRKQYRGAKAVDCTCRNHGSCIYCYSTRMYRAKKEMAKAELKIKEYLEER